MTDGRKLDEATGARADVEEIKALLEECLRRVHAFPLEAGSEPATTWQPESPRG